MTATFNLFSTYTTPDAWVVGMAGMRHQDYFTREAIYDALPCLGLKATREIVEGLVRSGDVRMVIPPGKGALGTYCLESRVNEETELIISAVSVR